MFSYPIDIFFDRFLPVARERVVEKKERDVRLKPASHVAEVDNEFVVEMMMPGLDEGTLKVKVVDEELHIEGERTSTMNKGWHGKVMERVALTPEIDADGIEAKYCNGVLKVILPKNIKKNKIKEIAIS